MLTLLGVGFVAGLVTAISPCILPVLPVIFAGASTGGRRRSIAIVVGLVASFAVATLFGVALLTALHLPQDLLNDLGYAMLLVLAVALIVDPIGDLLERPFARLSSTPRVGAGTSSGIVLGLGLGLVFVPCAGLILSAISAVAATHRIGLTRSRSPPRTRRAWRSRSSPSRCSPSASPPRGRSCASTRGPCVAARGS